MALRSLRDADPLPPHDLDAEQAVLGACLLDRDAITRLAPYLTDRDFYRHAHGLIWAAMTALYYRRVPIDMVTLVAELRRRRALDDAGGETYIAEVVAATPTSYHAAYYADIVRDTATRRRLIEAASNLAGAAWDEHVPISDAVEVVADAVSEASKARTRDGYRTLRQVMDGVWETIDSGEPLVFATGITPLDATIGGVRGGQLVTIAARPAVGKSSIATQIAVEQGKRGRKVGYISLEMDSGELGSRALGIHAAVPMHAVRLGRKLSDEQRGKVSTAIGQLSEMPVFVDDRSDGSLADVLARSRALIAEEGISVLIIDHLHLMFVSRSSGRVVGNRTQEVGVISQSLKTLAREHGIVVIALAQLSRAMEHRNPPVPHLSDLRDSGTLEQDSDIVIFLHRPELYQGATKEDYGIAHLIVAKHRMGPTGSVAMRFLHELTLFRDMEAERGA